MIQQIVETTLHVLLLIFLPPVLFGVINKTKALMTGRTGAPILQPYFDLVKLMKKRTVQSTSTTWVFRAGPVIGLVTVFISGLLIPLGETSSPIAFTGDMILFISLFALGRFFTVSAALDTGSAFEGMGSAREATFALLSEPSLVLALLVLAKLSGSLSLSPMLHGSVSGFSAGAAPSLVLIGVGLFIVLLAEASRIPVDDPATHLELTMIHEAMVLDHSGPLLGIIEYSTGMKLFVLGSVLIDVIMPVRTGSPWGDWALFLAGLVLLSLAIGILESVMARLQMRRVPYLLVAALLLCGSGFVLMIKG